ncbi:MAG: hypothetical protein J6S61_04960, partial [Elusimicrobiaceae bacterium]|nr:hypothetical protein [Elusimicrobiaceae bacterium]
MKIKYLLLLSLVLLLPVASNATDSVEEFCDNIIYNEAYDAHHYKPDNASHLRYVLGDRGNKGKYKYEVLKFCDRKDFCAQAQFGEVLLGDHRSLRLNMVAYALEFNNIEVFETLILNRPEFSYLIDSGLYAGEEKILSNWG